MIIKLKIISEMQAMMNMPIITYILKSETILITPKFLHNKVGLF